MASAWGGAWGNAWGNAWGTIGAAAPATPVQPVLPIRRPQIRQIDAKTIADRFNEGAPKQEDYIFPNRKFYQE